MHKVSIIIPVHNAEAYIRETLTSCTEQTYKNIEIILVENGSTDASWAILQEQSDARIRIFQSQSINAAAARNYGYKQSEGDFITFLDADDVLSKNKIETQVTALIGGSEGWIASCAWAKFTTTVSEAKVNEQSVWKIKNPIEWLVSAWTGGGMMVPGCWLIPKAIIEKAGLWDDTLTLHDDGEFMCRVLLASKGNVFVDDSKLFYRQSTNSLSKQNNTLQAAESSLKVYTSYETHILKIENSSRVRTALVYNYAKFQYHYHPDFPKLIALANKRMTLLDSNTPKVGGKLFNFFHTIIGFKNALWLKRFI